MSNPYTNFDIEYLPEIAQKQNDKLGEALNNPFPSISEVKELALDVADMTEALAYKLLEISDTYRRELS